jgi:hypothetical protein
MKHQIDQDNTMFYSDNDGENVCWKNTDALVGFSSLENSRHRLMIQIRRVRRPFITLYEITLFSKNILSGQDSTSQFR